MVRSTVRDATYVLDGVLDCETELPIAKHTTDTAGYSDILFALFDLVVNQRSPAAPQTRMSMRRSPVSARCL